MLFDLGRLPDPRAYFEGLGLTLLGKGAWATTRCEFHGGSDSMRVLAKKGAWICMACNRKGGDIVSYQMQMNGQDFTTACQALGLNVRRGHALRQRGRALPFSARDGLSLLCSEANLIAVAACNISNGVKLTDADRNRLLQAARRVAFIAEVTQ